MAAAGMVEHTGMDEEEATTKDEEEIAPPTPGAVGEGEVRPGIETYGNTDALEDSLTDPTATEPSTIRLAVSEQLEVQGPVTRFILEDLAEDARKLEDSVNHMLGGLKTNLSAFSAVSMQYMEAHCLAVEGLGAAVDKSIDAMSCVLVRCGQLSESMAPLNRLMTDIKTVKRTLDALELHVSAFT